MYDDIILLAMKQQLLQHFNDKTLQTLSRLSLWNEIGKIESTQIFEQELQEKGLLTFDHIFNEPLGQYLIKWFVQNRDSHKIEFIQQVKIYKKLKHSQNKQNIARKIYEKFCKTQINDIDNKYFLKTKLFNFLNLKTFFP